MTEFDPAVAATDDVDWQEATRWAGAFLASFKSVQTRRSYRRDLECWFTFCTAHRLHPFTGVRRTHLELYLRALEMKVPPPASGTLY
jgi:transposase-like protein